MGVPSIQLAKETTMYPFMINIQQKKIVVIGGGRVAETRVQNLLRWQPQVTVISPKLDESLHRLWNQGMIDYESREFRPSDVLEAFIVIAATNDRSINQAVKNCCAVNQLYNIVDDPQNSSLHFPAFYEKCGVTVSVGTNGISPMLAKKLRDEFAIEIDKLDKAYVQFLLEVRNGIKKSHLSSLEKRAIHQLALEDTLRIDAEKRALFLKEIEENVGR